MYMVLFSSNTLNSGYCAVLRNTADHIVYNGAGFFTHDPTADQEIAGGLVSAGGGWQAIPEPATFVLFGIGGMGAWMVRRRKRLSV